MKLLLLKIRNWILKARINYIENAIDEYTLITLELTTKLNILRSRLK